jgi:hypothetical protein
MTNASSFLRFFNASALMVMGASLVACGGGGAGTEYTQFANGFDFAVKAEVTSEDGKTTIIDVPARGRVGADFEGTHTIEFKTADGTSMGKKKLKLTPGDKRKEGCQDYINVLGSAAIVEEEIVYGVGIKGSSNMMSGHDFVKVCPRWGFETTKPPEQITVKEGTVGMDRKWLHYIGDGDWVAAIDSLLAKKKDVGDQSRIRAWNIAVAVSKFDKTNPRLKALGPKFVEACHRMEDMFKTGPMAGKAQADCLKNTKGLFPDA